MQLNQSDPNDSNISHSTASPWIPQISQTLCNGCGDCIENCPSLALSIHSDNRIVVNSERCIYCASCEDTCSVGAIELPFLIIRDKQLEE